jgi:hypothetical protein
MACRTDIWKTSETAAIKQHDTYEQWNNKMTGEYDGRMAWHGKIIKGEDFRALWAMQWNGAQKKGLVYSKDSEREHQDEWQYKKAGVVV